MNPKEKIRYKILVMSYLVLMIPLGVYSGTISKTEMPVTSNSDEALQLFIMGREAFEMGRAADASDLMEKALQKDNGFALVWLYKSYLTKTENERLKCMENASQNSRLVSQEEKILIEYEQARSSGQAEKCLELAKKLASMQPGDARVLLLLAAEYHGRGQVTKFRDLAMDAIRFDPASPLGFRALAASWLYHEPRDLEMALKYIRAFVDLRPGEASAYVSLGDINRIRLDLIDARDNYSKAIAMNGAFANAYAKRGYINTYLGFPAAARTDFERAVSLREDLSDQWPNSTIWSYLHAGRPASMVLQPREIQQFRKKSVPMNGNSDHCYFCCTFLAMVNGFYINPDAGANECLNLVQAFNHESVPPDECSMEANFVFAETYRLIQSREFDIAEQKIKLLEEKSGTGSSVGKNEACNFLTGLVYSGKNQYRKALASFKRSDTENPCVKYNIAVTYNKLGYIEEAEKLFSEISNCRQVGGFITSIATISDGWLKSLALAREKAE